MVLVHDGFPLEISAATKYFSWGKGGGGGTFASCLFSIYHTKVETVARVYRAIFYSLSSLPPLHSLLIFRSRPFVTLHYLLLRNVVDASFPLRCAGKISGANRFAISSIHKRGTNRRRFFLHSRNLRNTQLNK